MSVGSDLESNLKEIRRRPSAPKLETVLPPTDTQDQHPGRCCRTSSLAAPGSSERALLDLLVRDPPLLQPVNVAPSTPLPRRHSEHCRPSERTTPMVSSQPPPVPLRPPAVPERTKQGPPPPLHTATRYNTSFPPTPHAQPPIPPPYVNKTQKNGQPTTQVTTLTPKLKAKIPPPLPAQSKPTVGQPKSPPPPAARASEQPASKISVRQDSNVSSDSFSQNSSPSYTTKSLETPLLPHHGSTKTSSAQVTTKSGLPPGDATTTVANTSSGTSNTALTKSISTPASLQTIVRFHHGSNMSLHHRIIRDMRRPSTHYITRGRLRFRFAQVLLNAVALLAIAGGLAAYFKAYPSTVRYVNTTSVTPPSVATPPENPAPGICLPVIVSFCHYHKVPYNFTMFPNYMGHFTQRDAQQELEVYNAVVDVRCYELSALFLCSVFVPKCGPTGQLVRPCRSLCSETKRRCGFFLEVFSLSLPDYLECALFPESADTDVCVGHQEVIDAEIRAQKPLCTSGFQCDTKRCIPSDWRCDGHLDCEDRTDEMNCHKCEVEGMVHCGGNKCMAQSHVCDGEEHCPWGQDERNCIRLSERMGDEGYGKVELFDTQKQDWRPACISNWDHTSSRSVCTVLGYASTNSSSRVSSSGSLSSPLSSPSIRRVHQMKQTLLRELRTCPLEKYPALEVNCTHYICGKGRHYNQRPSTRIIGGVESSPGDWPFLAALLGGPEEVFYCAGVLIADQWVLTASHCVGNQSEPSGWTIQLGITRRHSHSYFSSKVKVRRVLAHPMYNVGVAHDNDVALFQLKKRVRFHEHLLPVCLPPPDHDLVPGTVCTVIGWGKKEDRDASEYEPAVNEVQVPVLNRELCNSWLEHRDLNVTEGMICAGYPEGGKDACQGDSGGPLLCRDEKHHDRWFVGGIVSWGIKCAHPHLPGVYAYVPKYVPWIRQQMAIYSD